VYRVPDAQTTQFPVRLPQGIYPAMVTAGYDAAPDDPYQSFALMLALDWREDAPHIADAWVSAMDPLTRTVPRENVRLAAGGPLRDPDVWDDEENTLICDVTFAEAAAVGEETR
jgi:hypothetical protein